MEASNRAKSLVQRILTFSRRSDSTLKPLDINREIVSGANFLQQTLPKMVEIQLDLSDELDAISSDPYQIEQIIVNLATNARDAMPDGGTLTITTSQQKVDGLTCIACGEHFSGDYAVIMVNDTGEGMSHEGMERVFDPFYTTKEVGKGTGLGLSTVLGIVRNHNGHITCSSELGKGTTFQIFLPPSDTATNGAANETPREAIEGGQETILLVDDEEHILDIESQHLSGRGVSSQSGRTACRKNSTIKSV